MKRKIFHLTSRCPWTFWSRLSFCFLRASTLNLIHKERFSNQSRKIRRNFNSIATRGWMQKEEKPGVVWVERKLNQCKGKKRRKKNFSIVAHRSVFPFVGVTFFRIFLFDVLLASSVLLIKITPHSAPLTSSRCTAGAFEWPAENCATFV